MEKEDDCQRATSVLPSSPPPHDGKQVDEAAQVSKDELDPVNERLLHEPHRTTLKHIKQLS